MKKVIVSDTGPLIALAKLNCLDLLFCSFAEIHIPEAVLIEATSDRHRLDARLIDDFVKGNVTVHQLQNEEAYSVFRNILDEGESQALALATRLDCGVLIDETLGRKIAQQHKIPVIGIMGVLLQAKEKGEIAAIQPLIEEMLQNGYRLSDRVIQLILKRAGE